MEEKRTIAIAGLNSRPLTKEIIEYAKSKGIAIVYDSSLDEERQSHLYELASTLIAEPNSYDGYLIMGREANTPRSARKLLRHNPTLSPQEYGSLKLLSKCR
jgi:hypothetical protein